MIPSYKQSHITQANHINSPQFDAMFQTTFAANIGDCVILMLPYENSELKVTIDGMKRIKRAVKMHFTHINSKRPLMILYQTKGVPPVNSEEFFKTVSGNFS